jgi:hypothetical protein
MKYIKHMSCGLTITATVAGVTQTLWTRSVAWSGWPWKILSKWAAELRVATLLLSIEFGGALGIFLSFLSPVTLSLSSSLTGHVADGLQLAFHIRARNASTIMIPGTQEAWLVAHSVIFKKALSVLNST